MLDDLSTGSRATVPDAATTIVGDVPDGGALERAMADVDVVFHQAAVVDVGRTVEHPRETNATNLDGTLAVLDRAREEDARVVLASSAAVYGSADELPIAETAPFEPRSPYAVQKSAADEYARRYADLYELPTVALRYFNVFGPDRRGPYSGVISTFLSQARAGDPITVNGDGEQTRDFVHVDDVVRANLLAATTDDVGAAYNVGSGTRTSIRELAETVRDATGADVPIVHEDPRPGDVRHSVADLSRASRRLGYEPTVELEDGLRSLSARRTRTATSDRTA